MKAACSAVAALAALTLAAVAIVYGTYAAGGSDSSCYALMADAMSSGSLQPTSVLALQVPWPDALRTFTPGGFLPSSVNPAAFSPICAPGFSVLLAPLMAVAGRDAMFLLTPVAGALLVWMTFLAGRNVGGPITGAMSSVLIAASPPVIYQVVQPMNDIATTASWIATFVALTARRWSWAGLCCGLALLVRPNLLPLAMVAGLFVIAAGGKRPAFAFAACALPFVAAILYLNAQLYGSPFRTGYGQLGNLFGLRAVTVNAPRYFRWFIDTHTAFPVLAVAAPLLLGREKARELLLAYGLTAATLAIYLVYIPFDDWSYLRFLLPAIVLSIVLASAVAVRAIEHLLAGRGHLRASQSALLGIAAVVATIVAMHGVRVAIDRQAFNLHHLEQRYRSAGLAVRDTLPANAVLLSVWDSGAVRFHGRKEAISWEAIDPAWLDRSLTWLQEHGYRPYLLLESWEESRFRARFGGHSEIGGLDWPPRFEIDRLVRIYDPADHQAFNRGDRIATEYLWPLRR